MCARRSAKMESLLRIIRYPYEEPHEIKVCVEASNGRQKGSVEFYTDAEDLVEIGDALIDFPFGDSQEYIYEIGTEDPACLLYTSPSPRDQRGSRMPSSA